MLDTRQKKVSAVSTLLAACFFAAASAAEPAYSVEFEVNLAPGKQGKFMVEVHPEWAPNGAARFRELLDQNFFKGQRFFRVIDDFVAQFGIHGNPAITSSWASKTIKDDPAETRYNTEGTLAFAHKVTKDGQRYGPLSGTPAQKKMHQVAFAKIQGMDSRATQLFINLQDNSKVFNKLGMVPFAMVTSGMDVVKQLYSDYGETAVANGGGNGPDQTRILQEGNKYLKKNFPNLSYIVSTRVLSAKEL